MVRVLLAERVSLDKGEKTDSIERQHRLHVERIEQDRASGLDIDVVDVAEDRSVSGDIPLHERPKLKKWFTPEGLEQWQQLRVTTQDRLSRNDMHAMSFAFKLVFEWNKDLVILDDPTLDLHTPEGRAIFHVKCIGPHRELMRIKARAADSILTRRWTEAWLGGIAPGGYTTTTKRLPDPVSGDMKKRKVLILHEPTMTIMHEMRNWFLEGETYLGIARRLNARGELTIKDWWRKEHDMDLLGSKWTDSTVKQLLTSPSSIGIKMDGKKPMHNEDGSPFRIADPVFEDEEWSSLQNAVATRSKAPYRVNQTSPLLGVVYCGKCGSPAYRIANVRPHKTYHYYRCRNFDTKCQTSLPAEDALEIVEQTFLEREARNEIQSKVWVPGEDHTERLKQVRAAIERLEREKDLRATWDDEDEERFLTRMDKLVAERNELKALPQRASGWEFKGTGVTYGEVWAAASEEDRRKLLLDRGVELRLRGKYQWEVFIPDDWPSRTVEAA
ncbi:recombinase family protein [Saccharothrix sp. HUAS TT1]|uniref:recombinase family protein n=1 Tax=unclassified Saccharothrix TaxID=2593673 RepID=UPI00345B81C8